MDYSTNIKTIYSIFFFLIFRGTPMMNRKVNTARNPPSMITTNNRGIQIGDATHSHDHVILPVSLRVKKIRNRTIGRPIPEDVLDVAMSD